MKPKTSKNRVISRGGSHPAAKATPPAKASKKAKPHSSASKRVPSFPKRFPTFGDLCEETGGLAAEWRRWGCTDAEIDSFKNDSPFILFNVVPLLHELGFSEKDILRHVPHDGELAAVLFVFLRLFGYRTLNMAQLARVAAIPAWIAVAFLHRAASRRIAALQNKAARGRHYETEKAKRRAMAAERRRISRRTTTTPCPSKEDVLEAWKHVHDSKEALVRFGSLMQDLECYVDNSLRFDATGYIVGRNAGVKGWLRANLPELYTHYSMMIRYKATAKKLRQIVGLADPTPVTAVLGEEKDARDGNLNGDACNYGAEKTSADAGKAPAVEVVRARAVYLEAMDGVPDVAARVMARIDALCDPERTDEAATLRSWREKYERAITVRRKDSWWKKLNPNNLNQREKITA